MKVTKEIINDLIPLYTANECSADTRALVEEYLQQNPAQAEELRRILSTPIPGGAPAAKNLDEVRAFREARRRIRRRSWLMAFAIFFTLAPLSFVTTKTVSWWMLRDAPGSAAIYGVIGLAFWVIFAIERQRSRSL
jgi:ferric-dicitrate binding protein FerR (iron transport regulator)